MRASSETHVPPWENNCPCSIFFSKTERLGTLQANKKSRRNETPEVFNCVGLLANESSGRSPSYSLSSLPRNFDVVPGSYQSYASPAFDFRRQN